MFQTYLKNIKLKLSKNFGKGNYSLLKKGISTLGSFFINPKYKKYIDTAIDVSNALVDVHDIGTSEQSNSNKVHGIGQKISPLINTRFKDTFDKGVFASTYAAELADSAFLK